MVLWSIVAVLLSISLIYASTSIYSILKKLNRAVWLDVEPCNEDTALRTAILLPFYRESVDDVMLTFNSIARQVFPRDKVKVFIIVENNDIETLKAVESSVGILRKHDLQYEIVVNRNSRRGKAAALNYVFNNLADSYDVVVVYDAGDHVEDPYHLLKISQLMRQGFVAVGSKVYRYGPNIIGKLSYIDTLLWYNVALPGLVKVIGYPLMSGEGLAISADFLRRIGGFPDRLTEDSYITIFLALENRRAALLNCIIYEGAPSTVISFVNQRLRWYRGYFECLKDLMFKYGRKIRPSNVVKLMLAYLQPLALLSISISFVIVFLLPIIEPPTYVLLLAIASVLATFFAPLYVVTNFKIKELSLLIAPIYWFLQGFIVVLSIIIPKLKWPKTKRTPITLHQVFSLEQVKIDKQRYDIHPR